MFLIVEIISRYIEIISGQNEIILLLFLIVVLISRYVEIISRQNRKTKFWFLIVVIICRYIEIISRQNEIIFFSNCRDNKSIYRDNKSTI